MAFRSVSAPVPDVMLSLALITPGIEVLPSPQFPSPSCRNFPPVLLGHNLDVLPPADKGFCSRVSILGIRKLGFRVRGL